MRRPWYLRYSLSYYEVQELLAERGIKVRPLHDLAMGHRYAPELAFRQRAHLKRRIRDTPRDSRPN